MIGIWDKLAFGKKSGVQAQPSDSPCAESYTSPPYRIDFTSFPGDYPSIRHLVASIRYM